MNKRASVWKRNRKFYFTYQKNIGRKISYVGPSHVSCGCFCLFISKWIFFCILHIISFCLFLFHIFCVKVKKKNFSSLFICSIVSTKDHVVYVSLHCLCAFIFSFDTNHLLASSHKLSYATHRDCRNDLGTLSYTVHLTHVIRIRWIKYMYVIRWQFSFSFFSFA